MSQVRTDAVTPQAQAGTAGAVRARPLSPHVQVWRWHITMAASIATRASGVALYAGALIVAYLAASLAAGPDAYATASMIVGSPLGILVLFGVTVSLFYHLAAGIRHLVWDSGKGFQPRTANLSAALCFAFGIVAALAVWAAALLTGGAR